MNWSEERFVKSYTRDTPEWIALPWQSRVTFQEMIRKVDRSGFLKVGRAGMRGIAASFRFPIEIVEEGIAGLLEDGTVVKTEDGYIIPNFVSAQESRSSDRYKKSESRARSRDKTSRDNAPQDKTSPARDNRDEMSRGDAPQGQNVPPRLDKTRTEQNRVESEAASPPDDATTRSVLEELQRHPKLHLVAHPSFAAEVAGLMATSSTSIELVAQAFGAAAFDLEDGSKGHVVRKVVRTYVCDAKRRADVARQRAHGSGPGPPASSVPPDWHPLPDWAKSGSPKPRGRP